MLKKNRIDSDCTGLITVAKPSLCSTECKEIEHDTTENEFSTITADHNNKDLYHAEGHRVAHVDLLYHFGSDLWNWILFISVHWTELHGSWGIANHYRSR